MMDGNAGSAIHSLVRHRPYASGRKDVSVYKPYRFSIGCRDSGIGLEVLIAAIEVI